MVIVVQRTTASIENRDAKLACVRDEGKSIFVFSLILRHVELGQLVNRSSGAFTSFISYLSLPLCFYIAARRSSVGVFASV